MLPDLRWSDFTPCAPGLAVRPFFVPAGWRFPVHRHDFAEIQILISGRMDIDATSLVAGGVQLLLPGQAHAQLAQATCRGWVVLIEAKVFAELASRHGDDRAWPFRAEAPVHGRLGPGDQVMLTRRLGELYLGGGSIARDALLLSLAWAMAPSQVLGHEGPPWLSEAIEAFAEGDRLDEGVAGLVSLCGRSREHVSRVLRSSCGTDVRSLVREVRLRLAERRIWAGEPVVAVAADCGFRSHTHFVAAFRRRFGCAPGQLRGLARGDA